MENISESSHKIIKMYEKLSYFDQYGGSVFLFIVLIIALLLIHSYANILKNIDPIKKNWTKYRCEPNVIPFAGLINKPDDMTIADFTQQNFNDCMTTVLVSITGHIADPIVYATYSINEIFKDVLEAIQFIREMVDKIRNSISVMAQNVMARISNIIVPLQQVIITMMDTMGKIKGALTAGLYTSLGTYFALKSLMGAIAEMVILALIILAAAIVVMWIISIFFPPFISFAMTMTVLFMSVSIPLVIIIVFLTEVLHVNVSGSIPGVPERPAMCFDKNTEIQMNDGFFKVISEIQPGDILYNNVFVTAKMRLDARHNTMYDLYGVCVSGTHTVKHDGKWLRVSEHPDAVKRAQYDELFVYCLNTSSKTIIIGDTVYADWDELTEEDIAILLANPHIKKKEPDSLDIHRYLDGGLNGDTLVEMRNGLELEIKHIQVGDVLRGGATVFGIVEVDYKETDSQYVYDLGPSKCFIGGPNLNICDPTLLRATSTLDLNVNAFKNKLKNTKNSEIVTDLKMYHLITNTQTFYANNVRFYHYNSSVELFLERYREKLLSMKYV